MDSQQKVTTSLYRQIAIDIAKNIASGKYVQGQKLFGRSVLASHYKTSPETIRKAVHLLKDVGILETEKGSGIEVVSVANAKEFVQRQNDIENVLTLKSDIMQWVKRQAAETADLAAKVQFLVDTTERLKNTDPLAPYEVTITQDSKAIGKSADELRFWHNTGGTIIAILRGDRLILSPGPYATFCAGDVFYIIGTDQTYAATIKLLF